jgi:AraC-like DNA-binding protein
MWAMQSFWRTDVIQIVKWLLPPLMVANFASGNSPLASLVEALERFGGETRNDSPLLLNLTANALVQSLISRASVPVHNGEPAHDTAAKAITCPRISIAEEASVAGMSARKLSKLFRELTGETPRTFGKAQRLRKAVSLLENGDLSVAEVAHASGYRSVTSFTKAFASVHGCPPTRWRRRRRAE